MLCNCLDTSKSETRLIWDYKDTVTSLPQLRDLKVVQCLGCGLVLSPGFPSDPEELSQINHALGVTFDTGEKRAREKIIKVNRILYNSKVADYEIIDIGGGSGEFSQKAMEFGITSHNYEPFSKNAGETFSEVETRVQSPNLVLTMFHVVEHVNDPIAWLSDLIKGLKRKFEQVYLLIEVPVIELETVFCDDPTPFYAPFHVRHFSIHTARETLTLAGMEILSEKANTDYNGYFFLAKPTLSDFEHDISMERELKLHDDYVFNHNKSMEQLRIRLVKRIKDKELVIFWGAGIGYDFFQHNFSDVFVNFPQVIVDKSLTRQSGNVKAPEQLSEILERQTGILMIPTSFAKSEEIIGMALEIASTVQHNSIEIFEYIHVRAY